MEQLTPLTREEETLNTLLSAAGGGSVADLSPETRKEQWYQNALDAINGKELTYDLAAEWRSEEWYAKLIEALQTGGGGSVPEYSGSYSVTPTYSAQTLSCKDKKMKNDVGIEAVVCSNLSAGNIKKDVVIKVGTSTDDDSVLSVTGTYAGSGGATIKTDTLTPGTAISNPNLSASDYYGAMTQTLTSGHVCYAIMDYGGMEIGLICIGEPPSGNVAYTSFYGSDDEGTYNATIKFNSGAVSIDSVKAYAFTEYETDVTSLISSITIVSITAS